MNDEKANKPPAFKKNISPKKETLYKQKSTINIDLFDEKMLLQKKLCFHKSRIIIGSAKSCNICLEQNSVSNVHAVIEMDSEGKVTVYDMASETGVFINGKRVLSEALQYGDKVQIGFSFLVFKAEEEAPSLPKSIHPSMQYSGKEKLHFTSSMDYSSIMTENEEDVVDIFEYPSVNELSLQLAVYWGKTILDICNYSTKKSISIGSTPEADILVPSVRGIFSLITLENDYYVLNTMPGIQGIVRFEGKMRSIRELQADTNLFGNDGKIIINKNDLIKLQFHDITIFINYTLAPPNLIHRRPFEKDPLFLRCWMLSLFLTIALIGLALSMESKKPLSVEEVPPRSVAVIFRTPPPPDAFIRKQLEKRLTVKKKAKETPRKLVKKKATPKKRVSKKTPRKLVKKKATPKKRVSKKTPRKLVKKKATPKKRVSKKTPRRLVKKKTTPKKQVSKISSEKQSKKAKAVKPVKRRKTVKTKLAKKVNRRASPTRAGNRGQGARASGKEGKKGTKTARRKGFPQNRSKGTGAKGRIAEGAGGPGAIETLKGFGGKINQVLSGGSKGIRSKSGKSSAYGGFNTKGREAYGAIGAGAGGGGKSQTVAGLGTSGLGAGRKGRGKGAIGKGGNLLVGGNFQPVVSIPSSEETVIQGGLDKATIDQIMRQYLGQMRYCYEKAISTGKDPSLRGKIVTRFVIGASGGVSKAAVERASLKSKNIRSCVLAVIKRIQFPEPKGGGIVEVKYPLIFSPSIKR